MVRYIGGRNTRAPWCSIWGGGILGHHGAVYGGGILGHHGAGYTEVLKKMRNREKGK